MDRSGGKAVTVSERKRRGAPAGAGLWITSLTGAAVSVLSGLIALLLAAFVAYSSEDPDSIAFPLSAAALYIGALAGGIVCSHRAHRTALAESAIAGAVQSALMLIVSVFQSEPLQVFAPFKIAASRRCICRIHARSIPRKTSHQTPGEIACRPEKARITTTQKVFSEIIL